MLFLYNVIKMRTTYFKTIITIVSSWNLKLWQCTKGYLHHVNCQWSMYLVTTTLNLTVFNFIILFIYFLIKSVSWSYIFWDANYTPRRKSARWLQTTTVSFSLGVSGLQRIWAYSRWGAVSDGGTSKLFHSRTDMFEIL